MEFVYAPYFSSIQRWMLQNMPYCSKKSTLRHTSMTRTLLCQGRHFTLGYYGYRKVKNEGERLIAHPPTAAAEESPPSLQVFGCFPSPGTPNFTGMDGGLYLCVRSRLDSSWYNLYGTCGTYCACSDIAVGWNAFTELRTCYTLPIARYVLHWYFNHYFCLKITVKFYKCTDDKSTIILYILIQYFDTYYDVFHSVL